MFKTTIVSTFLAATLIGPAHAGGPRDASARSLLGALRHADAPTVLARLDADPALRDAVFDGVESAKPAWLAVAQRLRPAADASDAEQLDMAVARALPRAPRRVLALVDHGFAMRSVCTSPFIEPAAGIAEAYRARALKSLDRVHTPVAAACAERIASF